MMADRDDLRNHPVFICGHPKAGTSLLRSVFDSHPQLVVYPEETVFFRRLLPKAHNLGMEEMLELADRQLIHIFRWNLEQPVPDQEDYPGRDYSAISFEEVKEEMRALIAQEYRKPGDILSAAVLAFGKVSGQISSQTRWWVEKSPYNEYFTKQIFEWWPEARCIHILRDPRDNFLSYRRKHPDWSPEFFANNWKRSTLAGLQNQVLFGKGKYCILRYEDLTQNPQKELERLTKFLEIDWDPTLVAPTRAGEQWGGNSMFATQFQEISTTPVARWEEKLPINDAVVIEIGAGKIMRQCGYEPRMAIKAGFFKRLKAYWRLGTWPIRQRLNSWTSAAD